MRTVEAPLFNSAALEHGYDVVATGHNLDDEAAVLLGNVLRWETGVPRPPAPGAARGARVRAQGEAARAAGRARDRGLLRAAGIDYQVEECPMAAGNRHLGYKEVLNALEDRSPGPRPRSCSGSSSGATSGSPARPSRSATSWGSAPCCGAPTPGDVSRVLPAPRAQVGAIELALRAPTRRRRRLTWPAPFAAGDRVLLVDAKRRRHLVTLADGGEFHTHAGVLAHDDIIGAARRRDRAHDARNARLTAVRPTLAEYVLEMPRGAQVIYPKDLGPILILADVFPGARVLESGVGSGALTLALLRAVGTTGHVTGYEIRDDFARRARSQRRGLPRSRRPARHRGARRLRRASASTTSTASCSTCPSRGGS